MRPKGGFTLLLFSVSDQDPETRVARLKLRTPGRAISGALTRLRFAGFEAPHLSSLSRTALLLGIKISILPR